ncbi:MbnP family protein, partial [Arthrospira platensis SPKY1]|nr:MbnP family protein [Arthrospira platensis SPKY1]
TEDLDTVRVTVEDNFVLVNPAVFGVKDIGTIRTSGRFERLRFTVGLSEIPNQAVISAFPSALEDHPLATEDMYWDFERGYIFNRIEMLRDTATGTEPTVLEIG